MECPVCGRAVDARGGKRVVCPGCGRGLDVVVRRSDDGGPMRSFEEIELVPDAQAAPATMRDLSGGARIRHVRVEDVGPRPAIEGYAPGIVVFIAALLLVFIVRPSGCEETARSELLGMGFAVAGTFGLVLYMKLLEQHRYIDVYIAGGRLQCRRVGRFARTLSIPIDEIVDLELTQAPKGPVLEARLRGSSRRVLGPAGQSRENLLWLRDHLRAGIEARKMRG